MKILVNGKPHVCDAAITIQELVVELGLTDQRIAVEKNQSVIPKSQHPVEPLAAGDQIEIVQAIGGG